MQTYPTLIDKFCDWFEGEFDNWTQAASNPTKWAHIIVKHEKISEYKYHTSSRYSYMQKPYREQTVDIEYVCPELIIVHNPACDIVFKWTGIYFEGESDPDCQWNGVPLESKARLYENEYHTWDVGYWEGSEGFFHFKKNV